MNKEERVEKKSILSKDDVVKESKGSKRVCIEKTKRQRTHNRKGPKEDKISSKNGNV